MERRPRRDRGATLLKIETQIRKNIIDKLLSVVGLLNHRHEFNASVKSLQRNALINVARRARVVRILTEQSRLEARRSLLSTNILSFLQSILDTSERDLANAESDAGTDVRSARVDVDTTCLRVAVQFLGFLWMGAHESVRQALEVADFCDDSTCENDAENVACEPTLDVCANKNPLLSRALIDQVTDIVVDVTRDEICGRRAESTLDPADAHSHFRTARERETFFVRKLAEMFRYASSLAELSHALAEIRETRGKVLVELLHSQQIDATMSVDSFDMDNDGVVMADNEDDAATDDESDDMMSLDDSDESLAPFLYSLYPRSASVEDGNDSSTFLETMVNFLNE